MAIRLKDPFSLLRDLSDIMRLDLLAEAKASANWLNWLCLHSSPWTLPHTLYAAGRGGLSLGWLLSYVSSSMKQFAVTAEITGSRGETIEEVYEL